MGSVASDITPSLRRAFGQPVGQALPMEVIRLLADLDRAHQAAPERSRPGSK